MIIAAVLTTVGIGVVRGMPLDVFPNFAPPQVVVQTQAAGLAPEEVESLLTLPIESGLNGAPGLTDIRSASAIGLSVVTLVFDWNTDVYRARQLVNERLGAVSGRLPQGASAPELSPISSPVGDVIKYALTVDAKGTDSQHTSLLDVATIANGPIRNRLLAIPGVTRLLVTGGGAFEFEVLVYPDALKQYDVTLDQVTEAVRGANANAPGGFLETPDQEFVIRGGGRATSIADIEKSVVVSRNGTPVRIRDVARVTTGSAVKRGDGSLNGHDAVILTITRQPFADTPTVSHAVEAVMSDIALGLPKDVRVTTTFRQVDFIDKSVGNVIGALRDGVVIVVLVLLLFLGNWRTMLITLTALPVSIVMCLLVLNAVGIGLNTMTLGGLAIALGAVIDDAIVYTENIYRRLRENVLSASPRPALTVIFDAAIEIRRSVVYATLILCLVMAPIFALTGVEGRIFAPLGIAYVLAIFASLVVALTLTPAMCFLLLGDRKLGSDETPTIRILKRFYEPILRFAMRKPWFVIGTSTIALAASMLFVPGLGKTFLPEFQERNLIVAINQAPGASLASTQRIGLAIEAGLKRHREIESVQLRAGRALGDDDAGGVNFGELDIQIAQNATDRAVVLDLIRDEIAKYPGISANVGGFISHRIDEVLSGTRAAIAIDVFGPDLAVLRERAQDISAVLRDVRGVTDLQVEPQIPLRQLTVKFDRDAAARYGLTMGKLSETLETALNGRVVSQILKDQRLFDLIVWLAPEARNGPDAIANLLVDTPSGAKIPLTQVASVGFDEGPSTIKRQNVSRRIVVSANASGRDIGSIIAEARKNIGARVSLPRGYFLTYGGQFQAQERATRELIIYGLLALAGVTLLLFGAVRSVRSTILVLLNLPLALIGGIIAIVIGGGVLSIASLVGFITLFGVANRNGIILVTTYYQRIAAGEAFPDAILEGSLERLSPVLMTALTAALAMVPLMIGAGAGKEILQPLATVVFGGLFTSTVLTLVVLPALFVRFGSPKVPNVTPAQDTTRLDIPAVAANAHSSIA